MSEEWEKIYTEMLDDCEDCQDQLNAWELGFIDSLSISLSKSRPPTRNQLRKLEEIWERVTKSL